MINIETYYGLSSGGLDWTKAFHAALSRLKEKGGGILCVPQGRYPTRSLRLYSDITLVVEAGATIVFLDDFERYDHIGAADDGTRAYMPCLYAEDARNIVITGQGTLDGNGSRWWTSMERKELHWPAPPLICLRDCERVTVEGLLCRNAPVDLIRLERCRNAAIRGVTLEHERGLHGVVLRQSSHVRISDAHIDVGGKALAIGHARGDALPCAQVLVTGCSLSRGGILMGPSPVRGVLVQGVLMDAVRNPLDLRSMEPPGLNGIHLENLHAMDCTGVGGNIRGVEGAPIEGLTLSDITLSMARHELHETHAPIRGLRLRNVRGLALSGVHVLGVPGEAIDRDESVTGI